MRHPIFNIKQIYYDDASRGNCSNHPLVTPIDNSKTARPHYFENGVISMQMPTGAKYFGVWSHKAKKKIRQAGNKGFTFEQMEQRLMLATAPVIAFHHNCKKLAIFHNKEGNKLAKMMDCLMEFLGYSYRVGQKIECAIMQNHFLATVPVYTDYISELNKAMCFIDSNILEAKERSPYKRDSQVDYTYHTFILERFASAFVIQNNIPFQYYKELK